MAKATNSFTLVFDDWTEVSAVNVDVTISLVSGQGAYVALAAAKADLNGLTDIGNPLTFRDPTQRYAPDAANKVFARAMKDDRTVVAVSAY